MHYRKIHLLTLYMVSVFIILSFSCRHDNRLLQGKSTESGRTDSSAIRKEYNKEGILTRELMIKNGLIDGYEKKFYPSGKLMMERKCLKGISDGLTVYYYENGNKNKEIPYLNGKITGTIKKFYKDGSLSSEAPMENGLAIPGIKEYNKSGKLIEQPEILIDDFSSSDEVKIRLSLNQPINAKFYIIETQTGENKYTSLIGDGTFAEFFRDKTREKLKSNKIRFIARYVTKYLNHAAVEKTYEIRDNVK